MNAPLSVASALLPDVGAPLPVTIDIGPAVHQGAGLSRYAERLVATLAAQQPDLELSLFYNDHSHHQPPTSLAGIPVSKVHMGQYNWRLQALGSQMSGRTMKQVSAMVQAGGVYHATEHLLPKLPCPTIMTVHDLIFERYPQHHTWRNVQFLRTAMPRFVRAASAIIAISKRTRDDLIEFYQTPTEKIHVIYEGIDKRFRPASEAEIARVKAEYSPDRPWLLMVGTLEPRKNHAAAIRALRLLKREGFPHRLLCVGGKGWLFGQVNALVAELGLKNDVVFAGYAPDADLAPLYSGADCSLVPSLYEGFGFPVLEAMACNTPVVCSNTSSLPEVAGDAAVLIPPTDYHAIADAVRLVLTQPEYANMLRVRGIGQAAKFRWENCAAETAALYHAVAEAHGAAK